MPLTCEVADCDKPAKQRRMCYMHFGRWRKHGSTDDPIAPWQARFWSKVNKTSGCWLWTSATDHAGYGLLGGRAPERAAHRLAWRIVRGDPGDRHVLHTCDNPPCVRPRHLFLGDDAANHADMASKRRSTWGERNTHAKLAAEEVREIRRLAASGVRQREIAERFSISRITVSDIHRRKSWYQLRD